MTRSEYRHLTNLESVHPRGVNGLYAGTPGWPRLPDLQGYEVLGWVERFRPGGDVMWRLSAAGAAALKEERESGRPLEG